METLLYLSQFNDKFYTFFTGQIIKSTHEQNASNY